MADTFVKIPTEILARTDLTAAAKLVYAVLADRARDTGRSWAGTRRFSTDCGISRSTVVDSLALLEKLGLIDAERRGVGKTTIYHPTGPKTSPEPD